MEESSHTACNKALHSENERSCDQGGALDNKSEQVLTEESSTSFETTGELPTETSSSPHLTEHATRVKAIIGAIGHDSTAISVQVPDEPKTTQPELFCSVKKEDQARCSGRIAQNKSIYRSADDLQSTTSAATQSVIRRPIPRIYVTDTDAPDKETREHPQSTPILQRYSSRLSSNESYANPGGVNDFSPHMLNRLPRYSLVPETQLDLSFEDILSTCASTDQKFLTQNAEVKRPDRASSTNGRLRRFASTSSNKIKDIPVKLRRSSTLLSHKETPPSSRDDEDTSTHETPTASLEQSSEASTDTSISQQPPTLKPLPHIPFLPSDTYSDWPLSPTLFEQRPSTTTDEEGAQIAKEIREDLRLTRGKAGPPQPFTVVPQGNASPFNVHTAIRPATRYQTPRVELGRQSYEPSTAIQALRRVPYPKLSQPHSLGHGANLGYQSITRPLPSQRARPSFDRRAVQSRSSRPGTAYSQSSSSSTASSRRPQLYTDGETQNFRLDFPQARRTTEEGSGRSNTSSRSTSTTGSHRHSMRDSPRITRDVVRGAADCASMRKIPTHVPKRVHIARPPHALLRADASCRPPAATDVAELASRSSRWSTEAQTCLQEAQDRESGVFVPSAESRDMEQSVEGEDEDEDEDEKKFGRKLSRMLAKPVQWGRAARKRLARTWSSSKSKRKETQQGHD